MRDLYADNAMRMAQRIIDAADTLKASGETILVFPHKSVDGDCVGSSCAAVMIFRGLGAKAFVCMPDARPENMEFLGIDDILFYPEEGFKGGDSIEGSSYTMRMSVDCSESHRMGPVCGSVFDSLDVVALDIDHHEVTNLADEYKWIEPKASSACEMVFYAACAIAKIKGVELSSVLCKKAANALLAGIVTDTGRFTYTNTRPETLESAGTLMELGGNITDICYNLFDRKKPQEFMISNAACVNAELLFDGKVAITIVTEEMFKKFNAGKDDIMDVVSRLRDIDGVELAIVLREVDATSVRGNLRSKSTFDCSDFASVYNGGGHKRAAGFTVTDMAIEDVKKDVIRRVESLL